MKHFRLFPIRKQFKILNFSKFVIASSETKREAPFTFFQQKKRILKLVNRSKKHTVTSFDFTDFYKIAPMHIQAHLKPAFLEWFIGFAEGDGTFYIKREKKQRPKLIFEICQKDPKTIYYLRKILGFGTVNKWTRNSEEYWVYKIASKENVKRLICLFNGNLVLTKRKVQFKKWVKAASYLKCLPSNFKQKSFSRFVKVSNETGWLAGFIDAEGCFYATFSTPANGSKMSKTIRQKFHLTQKNIYDEIKVLETILRIFKSKAKVQHIYNKRKSSFEPKYETNYCRIELSSLLSHLYIIKYLKQFPLQTNKHINSLRWARVVQARQKGQHLIQENVPRLWNLCKSINLLTNRLNNSKIS